MTTKVPPRGARELFELDGSENLIRIGDKFASDRVLKAYYLLTERCKEFEKLVAALESLKEPKAVTSTAVH